MNPVIDSINTRRSVRFFDTKPIERNTLKTIVDAGNAAPSGMNTQGWRFVVVETPEARLKLAATALPKYKAWLEDAPQAVKERRAKVDSIVKEPVFYNAPAIIFVVGTGTMTQDYDCPMACENIMLAARSLNIGSCWAYFGLKVLEDPSVRSLLGIKEKEKVFGPLLLGYPKENFFPEPPPKKPAEINWV